MKLLRQFLPSLRDISKDYKNVNVRNIVANVYKDLMSYRQDIRETIKVNFILNSSIYFVPFLLITSFSNIFTNVFVKLRGKLVRICTRLRTESQTVTGRCSVKNISKKYLKIHRKAFANFCKIFHIFL